MDANTETGICGTCARPAAASPENQGYSDCCNDRIEYGLEAAETLQRANCAHANHRPEYASQPDGWVVCTTCGESSPQDGPHAADWARA